MFIWPISSQWRLSPSFLPSCKTAATPARDVRLFCREHKIIYQGFSLLTANPEVLDHPAVTELGWRENLTPAQIIFAFARAVGMLPLTGTSSAEHMKQDLASSKLTLPPEAVQAIETLAG